MDRVNKSKTADKTGAIRSKRSDFFINKKACLVLEDGTRFSGVSPAWQKEVYFGEVVFNTGMTGYVESLTDPSYHNQILVFTYPLVGNYGVQLAHRESQKIQVAGVVVSEAAEIWSHSDADYSLLQWLKSQSVPILTSADTRAITKHIRVKGTMQGVIGPADVKFEMHDLLPESMVSEPKLYNEKFKQKIMLIDCGAKSNILRCLQEFPVQIKVVPANYDIAREEYDAVFFSNGPGDPVDYPETIELARQVMRTGKPVFGICLGSQIMGLAAGAKTYKLRFGHRGHNQPCIEASTNKCYITSQNHSYAIDEKTLPSSWEVWFRNLNDNSVEGIAHKTKPFFSVQFHPEASPGPTDTKWLFSKFFGMI